jgi:hypothetical protein
MLNHRIAALVLVCGFVLAFSTPVQAQDDRNERKPPALLLILDSSGSMNGAAGGGVTKIQAAKTALKQMVDTVPNEVLVGLRVYGHRVSNAPSDKPEGCRDTELIAPIAPLDKAQMQDRIRSFDARGWTPIGLSLKEGAKDLRGFKGEKTIVLVSDGIETCAPPPPCKIARRIVRQGIDLRIDTVGFQVDPRAREQLRCIARVGKGTYVDVGSAAELSARLSQLSVRALRTYELFGLEVSGGTDIESAPLIGPGQYVDQISPRDDRYYAVYLDTGQHFRFSATFVTKGARDGGALNLLDARIYDSDGNQLRDGPGSRFITTGLGGPPKSIYVKSLAAGSATFGYEQPGLYFVRVLARTGFNKPFYPFELSMLIFDQNGPLSEVPPPAVVGQPTPSPTTVPSPEPTEQTDNLNASDRGADNESQDESVVGAVAAVLVPALAGAACGVLMTRRRTTAGGRQV